jgi:hypothetical protein
MPVYRSRGGLPVCVLLLALIAAHAEAQRAGCELLATDGIADTSHTMTDNEVATSHRRWFCDKRFASQTQAESYSVNGTLPFKGIPVKLGFDANRDNWSTWSREVCSDERMDLWTRTVFVQDLKRVNVELAKVIKDCIIGQKGLFVWIERTSDIKFKLAARFDSPLPGVSAVKLNFGIDQDAICEGQLQSFRLNSPNEHRWLCRRRKGKDGTYTTAAIQIAANSPDAQPSWGNTLVLPETYRPRLVATPSNRFPMHITAPMLKNCISRGNVCTRRDVTLAGVYVDRGVILTQTPDSESHGVGSGGHAEVSFDIPAGAHRLLFSVGNPYLGADCGHPTKTGMLMYVEVDGARRWEGQVSWKGYALSGEIPLRRDDRRIKLVGNTSDGTVDCDDSSWAQVRFDE